MKEIEKMGNYMAWIVGGLRVADSGMKEIGKMGNHMACHVSGTILANSCMKKIGKMEKSFLPKKIDSKNLHL